MSRAAVLLLPEYPVIRVRAPPGCAARCIPGPGEQTTVPNLFPVKRLRNHVVRVTPAGFQLKSFVAKAGSQDHAGRKWQIHDSFNGVPPAFRRNSVQGLA
jgi:hypothetical protein